MFRVKHPWTLDIGLRLSSKAAHHALINLSRDADVVQIVFADLSQFVCGVHLENFAALSFRGFTGLNPQSPGDVVQAYKAPRAQPPVMHRVEDSPHPVITEIDERLRRDAMNQAALEDKR